tara:strand:- start:1251 stop:2411 length:1161 start_codon:yes stop_codon:yes gene_type:complete
MAKDKVAPDEIAGQDELAQELAASLNKRFKDYKAVHFLGEESTQTDLTEWVSTGSTDLDLAISNRPNGGLPVGRIAEFTGLESSGKSLIMAHLLANTQKKGGIAVYIDTENALSEEFLTAIGVDVKNMLYLPMDTIEDIFEAIENLILDIRKNNRDRIVTIVVDSVAAATTKIEQDADYSKDGWATSKAIIMSKALRKITNLIGKEKVILAFTNQLREKLGAMFGDKYTTSGGKALPFHASCRVRLQAIGKIKDSDDTIIGVKTQATVVKNRYGPPFKKAQFNIFFDSGIDDNFSWLETLKKYKVITVGGAWHTLVMEDTGEIVKFLSKDWRDVLKRPEVRAYCKNAIEQNSISSYKPQEDIDVDDLKVDTLNMEGIDAPLNQDEE